MRERYVYTEAARAFAPACSAMRKTLVRHAGEKAKPDEERLREYTDANFPACRQSLAGGRAVLSGA